MERKSRGLKDVLKAEKDTLVEIKKSVEKISIGETVEQISLELISANPFQPRRVFDQQKIQELANSIKEHGVFQPIILKKSNTGYLIVAGERRYRAALLTGLTTIPAVIRDYDQSQIIELSLIENLQREDLTPIEEAEAYLMLQRTGGLTHLELAEKVSKSRSHVTNMLGLLNLPDEVKELLNTREISMGHARVLSKINDPKRIKELAKLIIIKNLSVRQIEIIAQTEVKKNIQTKEQLPKYYKEYEDKLKNHLGYNVKVAPKKLTINYKDEEELKKLLELLLK